METNLFKLPMREQIKFALTVELPEEDMYKATIPINYPAWPLDVLYTVGLRKMLQRYETHPDWSGALYICSVWKSPQVVYNDLAINPRQYLQHGTAIYFSERLRAECGVLDVPWEYGDKLALAGNIHTRKCAVEKILARYKEIYAGE